MKSLYEKYQSNKHLFVIPLLILVLALYFVPTTIIFEHIVQLGNNTLIISTQYYGWFYYWLIPDIASSVTGLSMALVFLFFFVGTIIFVLLSYKNIRFAYGALLQPLSTIVYLIMFLCTHNLADIKTGGCFYMIFVFVIVLICVLYICLFAKSNNSHRTKSDRIAELEKQVAELQSKLPSEND